MSRILLWTEDGRGSENSGSIKTKRGNREECKYKRKYIGSKDYKCFNNGDVGRLGKVCREECERCEKEK